MAIRNINNNSTFQFSKVTVKDIIKKIWKLSTKKATQNNSIPVMILKENTDIFANYMSDFFSKFINLGELPTILKNANITPVFNKYFKGLAENYRPVSILSVIAKIIEKLLTHQITSYMDKFLSKYQCGFWKGCSAQHCLLTMLEKWKKTVDQGKLFGALLTDLFKAFDY